MTPSRRPSTMPRSSSTGPSSDGRRGWRVLGAPPSTIPDTQIPEGRRCPSAPPGCEQRQRICVAQVGLGSAVRTPKRRLVQPLERIPRRLHQLLVRLSVMSCDTYSLAAPSSRLRLFPGLSNPVQGGAKLRWSLRAPSPGEHLPFYGGLWEKALEFPVFQGCLPGECCLPWHDRSR